ncbi:MAG: 5'-nucleotidase C-terminal domain-containing protein [Acidobacteria bacterium]|nr:5'-nucleotidase C-terminal domain-containing protein [Acidobacteriota bacterium]
MERYRARLIPVTADIPEDAGVAAVVGEFWKPISPRYAEVMGQAAGEFSSRGDDLAEYNLMADALRDTFNVDLAMENMGGIRAPLLRGTVTRGDLVMLATAVSIGVAAAIITTLGTHQTLAAPQSQIGAQAPTVGSTPIPRVYSNITATPEGWLS